MTDIAAPSTEPSAVAWFKSSYSGGEGNECVEIATLRTEVRVRDSKAPRGAALTLSAVSFTAFLKDIT
ncbi:hypothetical protein SGFS_051100 [Streptomyces graminofaciens]|uniref:DUF397 domain-containing protein n=1 Tax=Streptomyces graminofaciens TaxID=68212 RepID=A0ABM8HL37_9ACTN|nr:DUF397 domain-containing protein [Streptomyces graminofaciens]BBC33816.1 hypothetical protein SGFS_051100 [Streptomyces graminofaciens]